MKGSLTHPEAVVDAAAAADGSGQTWLVAVLLVSVVLLVLSVSVDDIYPNVSAFWLYQCLRRTKKVAVNAREQSCDLFSINIL